jgi:predicted nicotinamide N-methyase
MTRSELRRRLSAVIPNADLEVVALPEVPEIRLALLQQAYPQHLLDNDTVVKIMNSPMYWAFCWASGQVLARFILDNPHYVKGRRVLDFGAGSGVVAVAAAIAGARSVVVCDTDPLALLACACNAELNGVVLEYASSLDSYSGEIGIILASDVLYDRANLSWLQVFLNRAPSVLVADSRVRDFSAENYQLMSASSSYTFPDLDESQEFRRVKVYLGCRP